MIIDICGTKIRLTFSFVLVLALMLLTSQQDIVIICLISSLLHELGHIIFMLIFGVKILSVDMGAFGVCIESENKTNIPYKKDALIAVGGILVNFLLAFLAIMYYYLEKSQTALIFSVVNIIIASFNCLPATCLDMGRVLRSCLLTKYDENKCHRILNAISFVFVSLMAAFCLIYSAFVRVNVSLIAVTVYLYVITLFKKWS